MARGRAPKSTIFGTRDNNKNHDFVHEGEHQKARSRALFFAGGKAPKCTILCTKTTLAQNIKKSFFLTVTAIRTDSRDEGGEGEDEDENEDDDPLPAGNLPSGGSGGPEVGSNLGLPGGEG